MYLHKELSFQFVFSQQILSHGVTSYAREKLVIGPFCKVLKEGSRSPKAMETASEFSCAMESGMRRYVEERLTDIVRTIARLR